MATPNIKQRTETEKRTEKICLPQTLHQDENQQSKETKEERKNNQSTLKT